MLLLMECQASDYSMVSDRRINRSGGYGSTCPRQPGDMLSETDGRIDVRTEIALLSLERADRIIVRWMCGVSLKDRSRSVDLYSLVGVKSVADVAD